MREVRSIHCLTTVDVLLVGDGESVDASTLKHANLGCMSRNSPFYRSKNHNIVSFRFDDVKRSV